MNRLPCTLMGYLDINLYLLALRKAKLRRKGYSPLNSIDHNKWTYA